MPIEKKLKTIENAINSNHYCQGSHLCDIHSAIETSPSYAKSLNGVFGLPIGQKTVHDSERMQSLVNVSRSICSSFVTRAQKRHCIFPSHSLNCFEGPNEEQKFLLEIYRCKIKI